MKRATNILLVVLIIASALSTGYNAKQLNEMRDRTAWLAMRDQELERVSVERDNVLINRDNLLYTKLVQLVQMLIDQGVVEVPKDNERAR